MSTSRPSLRVLLAIVITVLAWASAFVVIRGTGEHFSPGALTLARVFVGTVLLAIVVIIGRAWVRPTRREWFQLVGYGVIWFGLYNFALNSAEQTLDAGTTAMLVNIGPLLIALGAGLLLGEGVPRWLAIGAGVSFLGVVLIGIATSGGGVGDAAGITWALVAAVTYAAGVLLQKPTLRRLPAAQVTFLGAAIGLLVSLPFAGQLVVDLQHAPVDAIVGAVYLGAVPTALAFSTWAYALSRMPAGQLGVTTYVVPPIAIILGLIFFAEVPPLLAILGGILCLGGVALSRVRSRVPERVESLAE
ncbi:MAG: DMT family transporter [Aeromicrobium sp.]